ncbi:hypothetical protein WJX72_011384 [[Myrmecia] bisecta]|uniref:MAT1 centre domain-containing protein n=1 Tax=[Myrmecia] bisecta TaxID=41462 RepID=A0AAW1PPT7_9CHLO
MNANKELQVRNRVEAIFNKAESDFASKREYDDYLEEREDIIFNLCEGEQVAEMEARISAYQRANYENIIANEARKAEASRVRADTLAAGLVRASQANGAGEPAASEMAAPVADGNGAPAKYTASYPGAPAMSAMPGAQPAPLAELPPLPQNLLPGSDQLRMALASGWTPDIPKRRAKEDAFTSVFVC